VSTIDIACPDLGDFKDIPIIDVLVKAGDSVEVDTPLVTLETDKATMDVPSPAAGKVVELLIGKGARVSKGTLLLRLETQSNSEAASPASAPTATAAPAESAASAAPAASPPPVAAASAPPVAMASEPEEPQATRTAKLLVLGAGPGGYTAAFRAADLGLSVTLVERWATLGGVCLNVGCIPSKALLHAAKVVEEAREMAAHGIEFGAPTWTWANCGHGRAASSKS